MHIVGLELMKLDLITYMFMFVIYFAIPFTILFIINVLFDDKNDRLMMLTSSIVLITYLSLTFFFNVYKHVDKNLSVHYMKIYYVNESLENLEINKDQIINDIINGKITNNEKNLEVYSQMIQISYDEYNSLKPYEIQYNNTYKKGNVKIVNQ